MLKIGQEVGPALEDAPVFHDFRWENDIPVLLEEEVEDGKADYFATADEIDALLESSFFEAVRKLDK